MNFLLFGKIPGSIFGFGQLQLWVCSFVIVNTLKSLWKSFFTAMWKSLFEWGDISAKIWTGTIVLECVDENLHKHSILSKYFKSTSVCFVYTPPPHTHTLNHKSKMLLPIIKMSYWSWIWHNLFDLNLKRVCLIFACSPQLLLIKVWSRDQQKKGHRVNKEGSELSKIIQMLFILLCQYCHVIHYTPLWLEAYECLQTIATPKDTANCCCAAIVPILWLAC